MIKRVTTQDLKIVQQIVAETVKTIYPNYYPDKVVNFFLAHHSEENILKDINAGGVYFIYDNDENRIAGTGTKDGKDMNRVFILPEFQSKGYGGRIMTYLENLISLEYDEVCLDSSLPAFGIYLKRGYYSIDYMEEMVEDNHVLCYHRMRKDLPRIGSQAINLNGRKFISVSNTSNGEVSEETIFNYSQRGDMVEATYSGGEIIKGYLIGKFTDTNKLYFSYQHINREMNIHIGEAESYIERQEGSKFRLKETWRWLNRDRSEGSSVIEELA